MTLLLIIRQMIMELVLNCNNSVLFSQEHSIFSQIPLPKYNS